MAAHYQKDGVTLKNVVKTHLLGEGVELRSGAVEDLVTEVELHRAKERGHAPEVSDPLTAAFTKTLQDLSRLVNDNLDAANDNHSGLKALLSDLGLLNKEAHADQTFSALCARNGAWDLDTKTNIKQALADALLETPVYEIIGRLDPLDYRGMYKYVNKAAFAMKALDGIALLTAAGYTFSERCTVDAMAGHLGCPAPVVLPPVEPPVIYPPECPTTVIHTAQPDGYSVLSLKGPDSAGELVPFKMNQNTVITSVYNTIAPPNDQWTSVNGGYSVQYIGTEPLNSVLINFNGSSMATITTPESNSTTLCDYLTFDLPESERLGTPIEAHLTEPLAPEAEAAQEVVDGWEAYQRHADWSQGLIESLQNTVPSAAAASAASMIAGPISRQLLGSATSAIAAPAAGEAAVATATQAVPATTAIDAISSMLTAHPYIAAAAAVATVVAAGFAAYRYFKPEVVTVFRSIAQENAAKENVTQGVDNV